TMIGGAAEGRSPGRGPRGGGWLAGKTARPPQFFRGAAGAPRGGGPPTPPPAGKKPPAPRIPPQVGPGPARAGGRPPPPPQHPPPTARRTSKKRRKNRRPPHRATRRPFLGRSTSILRGPTWPHPCGQSRGLCEVRSENLVACQASNSCLSRIRWM